MNSSACIFKERICAYVISSNFSSTCPKVREYDQEVPKSLTTDQTTVPRERDTEHRQMQHNLSKATSSLFLSEMIAKLERTPRIKPQTRTQHKIGATIND